MEGSEALARAAIVAGCRFFAGYPDDAVHRSARALRRTAARGRRRVHQRRVGARSSGHGVGRARDRRPRRDRFDGPRPVAHAGVVLGDHAGRAPAGHLQHGPRPAGLLPGHPRRRPRRLPPHRPRAAGRARRRRARATRVPSRRQVAQSRRSSTATTCSPIRRKRSRSSRSTSPTLPPKDWAVDGTRVGFG